MKETVKGLIIKRTPFKENDMLLTVLTAEKGKMNVLARGLRKSRRDLSGYQTLAYAELEIFDGRGLAVVDDAEVCEAFEGLRKDIESLALAQYFADAVAFVTTDKGDPELLRLLLNSRKRKPKSSLSKRFLNCVLRLKRALRRREAVVPYAEKRPHSGPFRRGFSAKNARTETAFHSRTTNS